LKHTGSKTFGKGIRLSSKQKKHGPRGRKGLLPNLGNDQEIKFHLDSKRNVGRIILGLCKKRSGM